MAGPNEKPAEPPPSSHREDEAEEARAAILDVAGRRLASVTRGGVGCHPPSPRPGRVIALGVLLTCCSAPPPPGPPSPAPPAVTVTTARGSPSAPRGSSSATELAAHATSSASEAPRPRGQGAIFSTPYEAACEGPPRVEDGRPVGCSRCPSFTGWGAEEAERGRAGLPPFQSRFGLVRPTRLAGGPEPEWVVVLEGCEAGADGFGGGLVIERAGAGYRRREYLTQLLPIRCVSFLVQTREHLACSFAMSGHDGMHRWVGWFGLDDQGRFEQRELFFGREDFAGHRSLWPVDLRWDGPERLHVSALARASTEAATPVSLDFDRDGTAFTPTPATKKRLDDWEAAGR